MDPSTPRYHTARCRVRPCGSWAHERVEQGLVRGMCVELSTFCLTPPLPTRRKSNPKCSPSTHAASNTSSPPPSLRTITKREEATWYVIGKAQMWLFRKCLVMYVWRVFLFGRADAIEVGFDNIRRTRSCCACLGKSHSTITTAATAITSRPSQATLPLPLPLLPLPPPPRELLQAE